MRASLTPIDPDLSDQVRANYSHQRSNLFSYTTQYVMKTLDDILIPDSWSGVSTSVRLSLHCMDISSNTDIYFMKLLSGLVLVSSQWKMTTNRWWGHNSEKKAYNEFKVLNFLWHLNSVTLYWPVQLMRGCVVQALACVSETRGKVNKIF